MSANVFFASSMDFIWRSDFASQNSAASLAELSGNSLRNSLNSSTAFSG
jgi:hypothetical protein